MAGFLLFASSRPAIAVIEPDVGAALDEVCDGALGFLLDRSRCHVSLDHRLGSRGGFPLDNGLGSRFDLSLDHRFWSSPSIAVVEPNVGTALDESSLDLDLLPLHLQFLRSEAWLGESSVRIGKSATEAQKSVPCVGGGLVASSQSSDLGLRVTAQLLGCLVRSTSCGELVADSIGNNV